MPTLKNTIKDLLYSARNTDLPVGAELKHGLHLHIRKINNEYVFTIYRHGVKPSPQEWNTCIAHWPYPVGVINWTKIGTTPLNNQYLQARIPMEDSNGTNSKG